MCLVGRYDFNSHSITSNHICVNLTAFRHSDAALGDGGLGGGGIHTKPVGRFISSAILCILFLGRKAKDRPSDEPTDERTKKQQTRGERGRKTASGEDEKREIKTQGGKDRKIEI